MLGRDHDLAVDDAAVRQIPPERLGELRKVAVERLRIAALDEEAVAVTKDDRAKPVPLGLEEPTVARGKLGRELREHRLDRRIERKSGLRVRSRHQRLPSRAAMRPSAEAHPASNTRPASSRSTTSGAWSEGSGFPLRASRSISAQIDRRAISDVPSK